VALCLDTETTGLNHQEAKVIEVEERLGPADLQACANYLNVHFAGMTLAEIRTRLLDLMKEEKAQYDSLLQNVAALGERAFSVSESEADSGQLSPASANRRRYSATVLEAAPML